MGAAIDIAAQYSADTTTVRAFAMARADEAKRARAELDASVDRLIASRQEADAALERCRLACELAERMTVFAARAMAGDVEPETLAEAAAAIREMVR